MQEIALYVLIGCIAVFIYSIAIGLWETKRKLPHNESTALVGHYAFLLGLLALVIYSTDPNRLDISKTDLAIFVGGIFMFWQFNKRIEIIEKRLDTIHGA